MLKPIFSILIPLLFIGSLTSSFIKMKSETAESNYIKTESDTIPVYNFDQLEPRLYTNEEKVYLVNFWAMWCVPCVKELPHIVEFSKNNPAIEILLVSMDFPDQIESQLKPFLIKNNINLKVVLLDDPDANIWIDKVDPNWSGAIPFTLIFNNKNRVFYEGAFESASDIEYLIQNSITNK